MTGAELLDTLTDLDRNDALALNAFNWLAFLYVRPFDAPCSGRTLYVEWEGQHVLVSRAPDMHLLPDLRQRIMIEAMQRGDAI